jgi:hypothetical protein
MLAVDRSDCGGTKGTSSDSMVLQPPASAILCILEADAVARKIKTAGESNNDQLWKMVKLDDSVDNYRHVGLMS